MHAQKFTVSIAAVVSLAVPLTVCWAQGSSGPSGPASPAPRVTAPTPTAPAARPGNNATMKSGPAPQQLPAPSAQTPSAKTQPSDQQQTVAPLSPQVQPPVTSGGGSARSGSLALSPGSEANPSAPGGGGKTLADCMGFWDPATHMTKQQWRATCQRVQGRLHD
jgi:hypothetical protein